MISFRKADKTETIVGVKKNCEDEEWRLRMKTPVSLDGKTILVTGSPGFIGANLVMRLLMELTSGTVISFDNLNDYYDPKLKEYRLELIE